jgi:hypothetical protein
MACLREASTMLLHLLILGHVEVEVTPSYFVVVRAAESEVLQYM